MPMASTAYLTVERRQQAKKSGRAKTPNHQRKGPVEPVKIRKEFCFEQKRVRDLYLTAETQFTVAFLILLNFIAEAANAQLLPEDGSSGQYTFLIFEFIFNISFTIELAWNMYGSWFFSFFDSGWNWFDFIIVMISLLAMLLPGLPGISVLRLFRAFRVFRLFKRIKSLKKIIEGVLGALPGVSQAFLVLGILMGIWSVIGVEFFRNLMPEFFGSFVKAMYTMFQIMTMDSWSSGIGRVIIFEHGYVMASVFFISYIFFAGIVMTNVVVAILLDKYLEAIDKDKQEDRKAAEQEAEANFDSTKEDPTKPEVEVYVQIDGTLSPLRAITWHQYRELEEFLDKAAAVAQNMKTDDEEDSSSVLLDDKKPEAIKPADLHVGGNSFFRDTKSPKVVFKWETSIVIDWLVYIGFKEYTDKFKQDEVDGPTLTQLNEVDLINMGMKLLRRKQFMTALYELLADCEWPPREADIFHHNNQLELRPTNSIIRNSFIRHNNNINPAGYSTDPIIPEESMTFHESNPRTPRYGGGVQLAEVRRQPVHRQDPAHTYDQEFIQE